jgi:hypothetical protein
VHIGSIRKETRGAGWKRGDALDHCGRTVLGICFVLKQALIIPANDALRCGTHWRQRPRPGQVHEATCRGQKCLVAPVTRSFMQSFRSSTASCLLLC